MYVTEPLKVHICVCVSVIEIMVTLCYLSVVSLCMFINYYTSHPFIHFKEIYHSI